MEADAGLQGVLNNTLHIDYAIGEKMPWTTSNTGGSCSSGGLLVAYRDRSVIVTPVRLASKLTMYSHIIKGRLRRRRRRRINATEGAFKIHTEFVQAGHFG